MSKVCDGIDDCVDNSDETDGCRGIKKMNEFGVIYYLRKHFCHDKISYVTFLRLIQGTNAIHIHLHVQTTSAFQ